MRKKISLALVFIMVLSISSPVLASSKYNNAGETLKNLEVLTGDENGNLMLDKNFKRQDMVVMISRLYREEKTAKNYVGTNVFKDLTASRKFYIPYVAWARDKGLIKGMEVNEFGFGREVRTQEFQTVLLRVLGYEKEANDWNKVPEFALNLNLMHSVDAKASDKLTRGQMAQMVLNALELKIKDKDITLAEKLSVQLPELFKIRTTVDKDSVNFKGQAEMTKNLTIFIRPTSSNITTGAKSYTVDLDKDGYFDFTVEDLQKGNYEYRLEGDKEKSIFTPFSITEENFDLVNVTTNNLKEISLTFSKPLDTKYASFIDNYRTDAGTITYVDFSSDARTVTLKLKNNMKYDTDYKLSVNKIKSSNGLMTSVKDYKFTALGTDVPKVTTHTGFKNYITINFNKEMDADTINDHSNYYINFNDQIIYLPNNSKIEPKNNNKVVAITLPEYISGKEVIAGKTLKALQLRGFKDVDRNDTEPLIINLEFSKVTDGKPQAIDYKDNIKNKQGILIDEDTVEIKFNVPILDADVSDFKEDGVIIDKVITDGTNIVRLELNNKYNDTTIKDGSISIKSNNRIKTSLGTGVEAQSLNFIDTVSPKVAPGTNTLSYNNSTIYIAFTEELEKEGASLYKRDIEITKNGEVLPDSQISTFLDNNHPSYLRLTISNYDPKADYYLTITGKQNGNISYIRDKHGNLALPAGPFKID